MKKAIAVLAGLLSGGILMTFVQNLGHVLYPQPKSMDPYNMIELSQYIKNAPFMALFFVILSYAAAALLAGWVSTLIAWDRKRVYALICGVLFLIQALFMMASLPTPIWFWILGIGVWALVEVGYRLALYTMDKKALSRLR
ncbi:hypothetical protein ACX3PU_04390 [Chryseobacterium sp. A301]